MTTAATPQPLQAPSGTAKDQDHGLNPPSSPGPAPTGRRHHRAPPIDPLSDRATEALIRKILLPGDAGDKGRGSQARIDELLPPLTSRNDVDLQLYAFLAIILREFVQAWYNKITPDETFVAEVVHVIAHCTRALEQRMRVVDLEHLMLHEIPEVVNKHINIYRLTHDDDQHAQTVQVNGREAYHALWPLPLLSPAPIPGDAITTARQRNNEAAYRQLLVQAVLTVLLPTEDLENPCLMALVGQIFSELIIGNVIANKVSQPWLLYEVICIIGRDAKHGRREEDKEQKQAQKQKNWTIHGLFVYIIQLVMFFISTIRLMFTLVIMSSSLPARVAGPSKRTTGAIQLQATKDGASNNDSDSPTEKVPVLSFNAWALAGNLIKLPVRMPWLNGLLSLARFGAIHGPGRIAELDSILDRLLSYPLQKSFSASHLPSILRTLRGSLFPNNAPGSSSMFPPSSIAEFEALRRRAAMSLWALVPSGVGRVYFGGGFWAAMGKAADQRQDDMVVDELENLLGVLGDGYCNKHLMYSILELILLRLVPELQDKGAAELLQERLG